MTTFQIIRKDEARHQINTSFQFAVLLFDNITDRGKNVGGAMVQFI